MSHWKIWDESGEDVVKECGGLSRSSCKPNGCLLKQLFFRSVQGMIVIRLFLLQICSHRLMQHICLCYHLGFLGDKWRQQRFKPAGDRRCNCFHGKLSQKTFKAVFFNLCLGACKTKELWKHLWTLSIRVFFLCLQSFPGTVLWCP